MPDDWATAQQTGPYTASTRGRMLAEEGYIHCSFAEQVTATATRFSGDVEKVVLLEIDPGRLSSVVGSEALAGSGEAFPHVYGPIDVGAVVSATPSEPADLRG